MCLLTNSFQTLAKIQYQHTAPMMRSRAYQLLVNSFVVAKHHIINHRCHCVNVIPIELTDLGTCSGSLEKFVMKANFHFTLLILKTRIQIGVNSPVNFLTFAHIWNVRGPAQINYYAKGAIIMMAASRW